MHCRQEIMLHILTIRKIALGIIADAKEEFYQMFCELKTEIEENWL